MSTGFDYPRLLRGAAEALVRRVVMQAAEEGLPGEHHFYLTFRTRRPGVEVPPSLLSRYPETMTVVLQHQYTALEADEAGFAVTLRFGGSWERIRVPFAALTAFLDPSVPFGLDLEQFEAAANQEPEHDSEGASPRGRASAREAAAEPQTNADDKGLDAPESPQEPSGRGADVLPFRPR